MRGEIGGGGGREDGEVETGKGGGGGGEVGKRVVEEEGKGRWITGGEPGEEENSLPASSRWFLLKMWVAY